MSAAGDFIDATLQWESSRGPSHGPGSMRSYGASVGAVRGTVRSADLRYPGMTHDEIVALSSELWAQPVMERRLAAIVLLQTHVAMLGHNDLTRIEGFVRSAEVPQLFEPLALDVIHPLIAGLDAAGTAKARVALTRWATDPNESLRAVAALL